METSDFVKKIAAVVQADSNAVAVYDEVLKSFGESESDIVGALSTFRDKHVAHVNDISNMVTKLGGTVNATLDEQGESAVEAVCGAMRVEGMQGALRALLDNEIKANRAYAEVTSDPICRSTLSWSAMPWSVPMPTK
jgi:hypothetical protein